MLLSFFVNPKRRDRTQMKRLFKSRKALSPVVAAIILIAVTVAVSIAVAAWMGALTFTFMQTEQVSITNMQYTGTTNTTTNDIALSVKNTGSSKVTITQVTVNDAVYTATYSPAAEIDSGGTATVTVNDVNWISGNTYRVVLQSSTGTNVASYEKKAS
jgi:flagellin-like protein